jgi:ribosomal protein L24E
MNISCAYCNKPLTQGGEAITVCSGERLYLFCSIGCRDLYGFRKLTNRICAREGCNKRVPEGNRMLCSNCHQRGNHLAESELSFGETERAHWERMERELHGRVEGRIRIYSSQEMSQEELRSLVPSLQEEAA